MIQEAKGQKSEADKAAHVREGFESCHNASKRDNHSGGCQERAQGVGRSIGKEQDLGKNEVLGKTP